MLVNRSVLLIICCSNSSSLEPVRCTFYDVKSKKIFLLWFVYILLYMQCSKSLTQPINNSESLYFWLLLPPFSELHAQVKSNVKNFVHNEIFEGISLLLIHRYLQRKVCCLRYRKFQLTLRRISWRKTPSEKLYTYLCKKEGPNLDLCKRKRLTGPKSNLILDAQSQCLVKWYYWFVLYAYIIYPCPIAYFYFSQFKFE